MQNCKSKEGQAWEFLFDLKNNKYKHMKKFLKVTSIFILIIVLTVGGWWVYNKYIAEKVNTLALNLIPGDAIFVVETSNLTEAWTEISNSKVWNFLTKNPYFEDLNSDIETLNKYLKENTIAKMALKDRELMMSTHMVSGTNWDFIFIVNMEDVSSILKGGLKKGLGFIDGYKVAEREYKGEKIIELSESANPKEIIYMSVINNLFVTAFTGSLIEKAIDQKGANNWAKNKAFKEVTENLDKKKLFRLFFNYTELEKFSLVYLSEKSETFGLLSGSLSYSTFNINLKEDMLRFEGYTGVDSIGSYVKALAGVEPGKVKAWEVMSDQTALYFSMGFDNYMQFYNNLIQQYKAGNAEDMEDIEGYIDLIERKLEISLQEHFFDWIGNEIAFVKLRPSIDTRAEDVVMAMHSKDIDQAKSSLSYITKRIKKKSLGIIKFEIEQYKNFEINILEMGGLFKLFFGKLFKSIEKPYFTYLEDYVVFSNSIPTLKKIIDDYSTGNTLSHKAEFVDFKDEFNSKSNITVYIRTPKIYQNLYYYSNPEDKKAIKENRDFLLSFARIGFQLTSEGNMFDTKLIAAHDPEAVKADKLEKFEKEVTAGMFRSEVDSLTFKIDLSAAARMKDSAYVEYWDDTNVYKIEGHIKDEMLEGIWKSFYKTGRIKSSVNYKNSEVTGEAFFYYDDENKTLKAEVTFEDEKVTGIYSEFHKNGARKAKINYDDGKPDGSAEFYYRNGRLKIEGEYKDGEKHGKWNYYDEKGERIGKERWKNGVRKKQKDL